MKTKPLTFLLALTFLFLFSGSVFGQEEVKKEYYENGKLRNETHYKNGIKEGLSTFWGESGEKKMESHYNNGKKGGRIRIRSIIEIVDKQTLSIMSVPYGITTQSLIESILKANNVEKLKSKKLKIIQLKMSILLFILLKGYLQMLL